VADGERTAGSSSDGLSYPTLRERSLLFAVSTPQTTNAWAGIEFKQQKTGKRLIVAMTPQLHAAIAEANQVRNVRGFYLVSQRTGKPYSYKGMADGFKRAAERAGVVDSRPNDLRAKSGTDAEEQGVNATKLLGHDDARTTKTYVRTVKRRWSTGRLLGAVLRRCFDS